MFERCLNHPKFALRKMHTETQVIDLQCRLLLSPLFYTSLAFQTIGCEEKH